MRKHKRGRRNLWIGLGLLILTGIAAGNVHTIFSDKMISVKAAEKEYTADNGIAVLGNNAAEIKITGNRGQTLAGKRFHVYKLFCAENSLDGESVNYTFNPQYEQALKNVTAKALSKEESQILPEQVTEYMVIDYIQSLNQNPVEGAEAEQIPENAYSVFRYFTESLRNEIVSTKAAPITVAVKSADESNTLLLSGLDYGYYIVDEVSMVEETHSASSLCMVNTANPAAEMKVKSDYPGITKKIREDDENADIKNEEGWNDIGDYETGQTIPYRYDSTIPNIDGYDTYYYAWHDRMDDALSFQPQSVGITISQKGEPEKIYRLTKDEYTVIVPGIGKETFNVAIRDIKAIIDREFYQGNASGNRYGQSVTLTYEAVLNERAAEDTGHPGFENDVRLEFSNDADSAGWEKTGYTPWDTVVCFTYKLNVEKQNEHQKALSGAKFRLYSDRECKNEVYVKRTDNGYIVMNRNRFEGTDHTGGRIPEEAVEMSSEEDGKFTILGLDSGTYYLKETKAPDGYRLLKTPVTLTVKPVFTAQRDAYIKGSGATEDTLRELNATAHIETFYDGLLGREEQRLITDTESGSVNLRVINKVGKKLPVTGTPAVLLMFGAGVLMMTAAVIRGRKKGFRKGRQ